MAALAVIIILQQVQPLIGLPVIFTYFIIRSLGRVVFRGGPSWLQKWAELVAEMGRVGFIMGRVGMGRVG